MVGGCEAREMAAGRICRGAGRRPGRACGRGRAVGEEGELLGLAVGEVTEGDAEQAEGRPSQNSAKRDLAQS